MKQIIFTLYAIFAATIGMAQIEDPVTWNVKVTPENKVTLKASIESPWHMYDMGPYKDGPNSVVFTFELPNGVTRIGDVKALSKVTKYYDEGFKMEIGYYTKEAIFEQIFTNATGKTAVVKGKVEWQVCNDENCLPPADYEFTFNVEPSDKAILEKVNVISDEDTDVQNGDSAEAVENNASDDKVADTVGQAAGSRDDSGSLWGVIISSFALGLLALLTPCVFPMIPMTVSFFLRGSGSKSRGRMLAIVFGLSIVALYTIPIAVLIAITYFGGGESVTADVFNWIATHWIPNLIFFLIFIIFAFSFFGAFELQMPNKLVNKSDSQADRGGVVGAFFMAITLVLVSFSCTGPIVGVALVKSTQGAIWEPIITMLFFSLALALPFTLFAYFPTLLKNIPSSGGWLNSIKVVFAFIMVAFGFKFLSNVDEVYHLGLISRTLFIAIWIVVFTLLGFYLLGKLRFKHDDEVTHVSVLRLVLATSVFTFVVYLVPGMWGAPLTAVSGFLPPAKSQEFSFAGSNSGGGSAALVAGSSIDESIAGKPKYADLLHLPYGLEGFFDFDQAVEYAQKINKPLFIDFVGHSCSKCREMEAVVWSDAGVQNILRKDYVIVALFVDDKKELPESEWVTASNGKVYKTIGKINSALQIEMFGLNAQPYYVLMNPDGKKVLGEPRSYNLDIPAFVKFLENGVQEYNKSK